MCQLNRYICIGYFLPTFGGYITVGGCLCALRALGWETCVSRINIFVLDIFCQHLGDIWQLEGVCAPFGRWVGKDVLPYCLNRAKLDVFSLPGVDLKWGFPNIWQSISLPFDKVFLSNLEIAFLILITSRCQIVPFSLRCQIVLVPNCPLFIAVPNCPFYTAVPNCPILHSWCQIVLGAKLSSFTLLVPNCPFFMAVPNCPRCQIVLGAKLSPNHVTVVQKKMENKTLSSKRKE